MNKRRSWIRAKQFRSRLLSKIFTKGKPDYFLLLIVSLLTIFGLVMVYDASVIVADRNYGDQFKFLKLQLIWTSLGLVAGFIAYHIDYHNYQKFILPAIIVTIVLLILVIIAGPVIFGSRRWFPVGPFNIQPSELAKLTFTIYLASWLSKQRTRVSDLKQAFKDHFRTELLPFVFILLLICFLIVIEPDLGTTAIVGVTAIAVYLLSGSDKIHTIGAIFVMATMGAVGTLAGILAPYRFRRIQTFIETVKTGSVPDPWDAGYQINQVLIAIGSGGFWGVGFGESKQKFFYLVGNSAFTDTIFAVFAEEFGFIGDVILVLAFFLFVNRGLTIAKMAPDRLGSLLAAGISIWIGLQAFLNIAANIALGPLTGIPLPFFSYGGSSALVIFAAVGILLNISRYTSKDR